MSDHRDNLLYESLAKFTETQQRIMEAIKPALEAQQRFNKIFEPISKAGTSISSMLNESMLASNMLQQEMAAITANTLSFHIENSVQHIADLYSSAGLHESMMQVLKSSSSWFVEQTWPTLEWLHRFDYSPLFEELRQLAVGTEIISKFNRLDKIYQQALYESKWFPYPGWLVNRALLLEISDIISTSKGASKRREQRIDKVVLAYYTDKEIKRIRTAWNKADLDYVNRKILCQAIDAFLRKEYALTISCLATLWDGLIYIRANNASANERHRRKPQKTREDLQGLIEYNAFGLIPSDYYNQFITSQCNSVDEVIDGVPNRNGVAHGWYKKYPNRKAALNAILLTDFIIRLEPKAAEECAEEN